MTTLFTTPAPVSGSLRGVELLVDPDDTGECVAELGARHDLGQGVAVCHPNPGAATLSVLGEDVLVALGKRPGGPAAEGMRGRAWELAGWWLRAEQVRHLVVLRAQLLPAPRWRELAELTAAAGARLWLVVHHAGRGAGHRGDLSGIRPGDVDVGPGRPWRVALSLLPTPRPTPTTGVHGVFPEVPDVEFPLFRTTARRLLDPAGFARVDAVYRATVVAARDVAAGWTRPGTVLGSVEGRHGAAVLQRHTIDAISAAEVLTRVRAVQAGFFTAGVFLRLPPRPGLPTTRVSLAPRLDPVMVERIRGLCSPGAGAAVAIAAATGLRAGVLRSIRLRDVLDNGLDQHLVADGTFYRIPESVAGLVRAAVIERHAQLVGEPAPAPGPGPGPGGTGLFTGRDPAAAVTERALQRVLDQAAAYAGVTVAPPSFPGVAVHDLRGAA